MYSLTSYLIFIQTFRVDVKFSLLHNILRYTSYIQQFWAQKLLILKVILNIQNYK